ncbi:PDDEXK-like family protein [Shewanella sp. 0m-11]
MLDKLLVELSLIDRKYEKTNRVDECRFNIFSLLRRESDEVALHSRFIGELLNPKGTHNQGGIFQRLLLQQLSESSQKFNGEFTLEVERTLGERGRIDLLLIGKHDVIVIENKIYAQDQDKQLERYNLAMNDYFHDKKKHLYYLTLFGEEPSTTSLGSLNSGEVQCISYLTVITEWLESCIREVYDLPSLRETIIQYRKLVEKLTGQTLSEMHKMEIRGLLLQGHNFNYALQIEEVLSEVKAELQRTVWVELQASLSMHDYDFTFVNYKFEERDMKVCNSFYQTYNRSLYYGLQHKILTFEDYSVHFYLEVDHCFYYGFTICKNGTRGAYKDEFAKKLPKLNELLKTLVQTSSEDELWIAWKYSGDKINFKNFNEGNSAKLADSTYRKAWVENVTKDVVELLKSVPVDL